MPQNTDQASIPEPTLSPSEIVLLNAEQFASIKQNSKYQVPVIMAIFLVFVLGCAWWAMYQWGIIKETIETKSWPTTNTGIITQSEKVPQEGSDNFSIHIAYRFTTAAGQTISANTVYNKHLLPSISSSTEDALLEKYKAGLPVVVHYLPANNESVLETDIKNLDVVFCLLAIFFCLIFWFGFVSQLKLYFKK